MAASGQIPSHRMNKQHLRARGAEPRRCRQSPDCSQCSTLWSRITGMHLGGAAEFSTFRRTLAAILTSVLGMTSEDDPQLSAWINAHLRVNTVPLSNADRLGKAEAAVLDALDPPLNLQGRPLSPIRTRLAELRRHRSRGPATTH